MGVITKLLHFVTLLTMTNDIGNVRFLRGFNPILATRGMAVFPWYLSSVAPNPGWTAMFLTCNVRDISLNRPSFIATSMFVLVIAKGMGTL